MTYGAYTWQVADPDRATVKAIAEALDLPRVVAMLVVNRGIDTVEAARAYLNPSLDQLGDPFDLIDMRKAVDRLARARDEGEHVLVFGDYDVDGISGTAILAEALQRYGIEQCSYGMPNRQEEGYGLNPDRVEAAAAEGVSLIVTVDNGITARDAADKAKELDIDLIITDHHQLEGELPHALAVVNPKRHGDDFAGIDLCGAGVAFKLAWALTGEPRDMDLAALGTVADIVPLRGENRNLVAAGLRHAAATERPGLAKLAKVAGQNLRELRAEHISFQLAPRINAGGRMGDGLTGLRLLLSEYYEEADELAKELDQANQERREIEDHIFSQAVKALEKRFTPEQRTIVLASRRWHAGVVGIVATRIQRRFYRPVVLVAFGDDGVGRGSGRSVPGFNMADGFAACTGYLVKHGGHAMAAGLTIERGQYDAFKEALEAEALRVLGTDEIARPLRIDAQVALSELDAQLVRNLERIEPIGHKNPAPLFCTYNAEPVPGSVRELRGGHLKLMLREGPAQLDAIAFRMGHIAPEIADAKTVDVAFTPQLNTWRGETKVQLLVKDIRPG